MERHMHMKELTPVLYGNRPVHVLYTHTDDLWPTTYRHWHERFELLVVDEGVLQVSVDGEHYTVHPGEVVVINPGAVHEASADCGVIYRVVAFELIDQLARDATTAAALQPILTGEMVFAPLVKDLALRRILDDLCRVYDAGEPWCELLLLSGLYALLAHLCMHYLVPASTPPLAREQLRHVTEYIADHFCEDVTTRDLSRRFGFDESYFCRQFRQVTGLRATEYIRILRLEKARHLLRSTDDSIAAIAAVCGFSDQNYFARCFKSHYGMTAGTYRSRNRSEICGN